MREKHNNMDDKRSHPLLAQVPLTVSPFVSLPTATTLPYTYKTLPSTLPASSTGTTLHSDGSSSQDTDQSKPRFVVSSTGHAAHPDEIVASCKALQAHLTKLRDDADKVLRQWQEDIKDRELAEKRRVAPGYLDREERILEPQRAGSQLAQTAQTTNSLMDEHNEGEKVAMTKSPALSHDAAGEELDRAFGSMRVT